MSPREESVFGDFVKQMIGKCCANYPFTNLDSPPPGNEMLKPKVHVLKDGVAIPSATFKCAKIIENILGCKAVGRCDQNGSLRMMTEDQRSAEKLIKSTINAISDKRVNQGREIFFNRDRDKKQLNKFLNITKV